MDAQIKRESEDGGESAHNGERGEGFVEAADHDAGFVVPARYDAFVAEGPAEVPGQEGEAEEPEDCKGCVDEEIDFGLERAGEMEEGSGCEGD